jgi:hypothetical protein
MQPEDSAMMEQPEPAPEVKKTGTRWVDILLSVSAIFISGCSLYLAQDSSRAMERLVQANSMPFLQLGSGNVSDGQYGSLSFDVENAGTGPARIHTFSYLVDGEEIEMEGYVIRNLIRACCGPEFDAAIAANNDDVTAALGYDLTSRVANSFLAAGESTTAFLWTRTPQNEALWRDVDVARQQGRITARACYCSLFDDCWVAETDQFPPRPVNSCEPEDVTQLAP